MAKKAFISFDYDHDSDLKVLLAGQAKNPDSPFEIADYSVKAPLVGDWKGKVKDRIRLVGVVIVICGEYTNTATGVSVEVTIAQDLGKDYFLLRGRSGKTCVKPTSAKVTTPCAVDLAASPVLVQRDLEFRRVGLYTGPRPRMAA